MFLGTTMPDVRSMIAAAVREWVGQVSDVYVGCSGHFTLERLLYEYAPGMRLHSNDVSVYSYVLGQFFAGQPIHFQLKPSAADALAWMQPGLATDDGKVATVMLLTRMVDHLDQTGQGRDNPYHRRMLAAYRQQWEGLLDTTRARLGTVRLPLASYFNGDVLDRIDQLPDGAAFLSFPPFFAGGYERLFAKINTLFDWPQPAYTLLNQADITRMAQHIAATRAHWILWLNFQIPDLALRGVVKTTPRAPEVYMYSSTHKIGVVQPRQPLAAVPLPRLSPGQPIGDTLSLAPLTPAQFNALRSQYLNRHIAPGAAGPAYAVLVDGRLVGCFAFSSPSHPFSAPDTIYLLSDFAVAPTDYPRLSKLVLYAALSREAQVLAERMNKHRVRHVFTTAFTDNPNSMKYRGLFTLYSRKRTPDADTAWMVNYQAAAGQWPLAEALPRWKARHGHQEPSR